MLIWLPSSHGLASLKLFPLEIMSTNSLDLEMIENDSNRAQVVATAVREACNIAAASQNQQQDWEAACQRIMNNKLLTDSEKTAILALFQPSKA
ncbi:12752_t:CDS:2 [Entrophospora sp. SA101]|nr:12752_t:CDS:2 [Entrophospora sp. SA101]CAJ0881515.1 11770_t:CDS:2 [Entrophospora sp. SA101]